MERVSKHSRLAGGKPLRVVRCLPMQEGVTCTADLAGWRLTSLEVGNRGSVSVILDYGDCLDAGGVFQREPVIGSRFVESKWSICLGLHLGFWAAL
jgi:hypothetical protein